MNELVAGTVIGQVGGQDLVSGKGVGPSGKEEGEGYAGVRGSRNDGTRVEEQWVGEVKKVVGPGVSLEIRAAG